MAKYHNHPINGPSKCRVGEGETIRGCPFGDLESDHYSTKAGAQQAFEKSLSREFGVQKVVVALDLDNTLVDFTGGFRAFLARKNNISYAEALKIFPEPEDYDFMSGDSRWFSGREDFLKHLKEAENEGLYKNLRANRGAVRVVKKLLKNDKVDLRVVTARDAAWNLDTSQNLKNFGLPEMRITNLSTKEEYEAHVFIDDKDSFAENILSGRYITSDRIVKKVIVPKAGYNKHLDPAANWSDIEKQLNTTVERLTR